MLAGIAAVMALYMYVTFREMRRIDRRVEALAAQLASFADGTDSGNVDDITARVEALERSTMRDVGEVPAFLSQQLLPMIFTGPGTRPPGSAGVQVSVVEEGGGEEGEEYNEEEDTDQIRTMLMAQIDAIDAESRHGDGGGPVTGKTPPESDADQEAHEEGLSQTPAEDKGSGSSSSSSRERELRAMKLDDLRRLLKEAGQEVRGNKDALVERLLQLDVSGAE
jgi:hypothetical protein